MVGKMTPQDVQVFQARKELVIKYRISSNPWPDGIDSKWDRWYIPEEWDDDGTYHGVLPMPKRPEVSVTDVTNVTHPPQSVPVTEGTDVTAEKKSRAEYMRKRRAAEKALKDESNDS